MQWGRPLTNVPYPYYFIELLQNNMPKIDLYEQSPFYTRTVLLDEALKQKFQKFKSRYGEKIVYFKSPTVYKLVAKCLYSHLHPENDGYEDSYKTEWQLRNL